MAIGEAIKRIEDPRLLVGKGRYVADLSVPGMLEACVVRSPYAYARIQGIDDYAARACRGVFAIFSAADLPPDLPPIPMRLTPAQELAHALQWPLARDTVRYMGEPVAVIVAGLLPIMWGSGTGSEVMRRIAAPMVGGMITAPLLSLFVIPAAYRLMRRRKKESR